MASRRTPSTHARPGHQGGRRVSAPAPAGGARHGLARVLSKAGLCSRSEAARRVQEGRVSVDGRVVRDPEFPVVPSRQQVRVDGMPLAPARRWYVALNKPRGLVTTVRDEQGRDTVYRCFDGGGLPWLAPAGRLDKASEGLLLFSNDPEWAARLTDPATGPLKTYRVQVDGLPDAAQLARMREGVDDAAGEHLAAHAVQVLRHGQRTAWLEVVLAEGRNRHIRRLLQVLGFEVLRLVRVAIGPVQLGTLEKGQWRELEAEELQALQCPFSE
ncbi:pseudouridine synthase [Stenotrophomonas sp. NLF4-10]|uniref:pseudouridine synthase n=1 Tax=Stenotrophomonas sp. NLF4-10 TaxID=2918754 RepID=UPI001EFB5784|nr:pseudouridine synthase [Stenotrophomonas sp. NLF4-10]MCG8277587.1 rRNA pseudouridine synthase [Stenotrophomonas sp. NLF4-10]